MPREILEPVKACLLNCFDVDIETVDMIDIGHLAELDPFTFGHFPTTLSSWAC